MHGMAKFLWCFIKRYTQEPLWRYTLLYQEIYSMKKGKHFVFFFNKGTHIIFYGTLEGEVLRLAKIAFDMRRKARFSALFFVFPSDNVLLSGP